MRWSAHHRDRRQEELFDPLAGGHLQSQCRWCERILGQVSSCLRRVKEGFEVKSEGETVLPKAKIGYLGRIESRFGSVLDIIVAGKTEEEDGNHRGCRCIQRS